MSAGAHDAPIPVRLEHGHDDALPGGVGRDRPRQSLIHPVLSPPSLPPFLSLSSQGHDVRKEIVVGITLGLIAGLAWKNWQWNDKATRNADNAKWDKLYPTYVAERRVRHTHTRASHASTTRRRV